MITINRAKSTLELHAEAAARGEDFTETQYVRFVTDQTSGLLFCVWSDIEPFLSPEVRASFASPLANLHTEKETQ